MRPGDLKVGDRVVSQYGRAVSPPAGRSGVVTYIHDQGVHLFVAWDNLGNARYGQIRPTETNCMAVQLEREPSVPVDDLAALERWLES